MAIMPACGSMPRSAGSAWELGVLGFTSPGGPPGGGEEHLRGVLVARGRCERFQRESRADCGWRVTWSECRKMAKGKCDNKRNPTSCRSTRLMPSASALACVRCGACYCLDHYASNCPS